MQGQDSATVRIATLEAELAEARDMLAAIRAGEVDAVLVHGPKGAQVYTLDSADRPYRVLVERMREGAVTLSDSGAILYCNQYFADMLHTPLEQLLGSEFHLRVETHDRPALARLTGADSTRGNAGELVLLAANGTTVPVYFSAIELPGDPASPRQVCGVVTDLTAIRRRTRELEVAAERLDAETQVRQAAELDRERLAVLTEASPDLIGIATLDGVPLYLNAAGRGLLGMGPLEAVAAKSIDNYFMPEDRARVRAEVIPTVLRDGRWAGELQLRHTVSGDAIPVFVDMFVLLNPASGAPVNLATITRDLSEQKQFEEQLRQSQKMEAVGQLTGGIAHDFNNLLTGIMGSLELLQSRAREERITGLERYIDAAMTLSLRAAATTQRLLAFSRRQPLAPRAVDVNQLVGSMQDLLTRTLGERIALDVALQDALWLTLCDDNQLESALLNLVINARDAMPKSGKLLVQTSNCDGSAPDAVICGVTPGAYVLLSVSDTGGGMAPDVLARAFDPFFTTKPLGQGTGLGLSMIYGFAKQSGGHACITSEEGHGTTVSLYLPRFDGVLEVAAILPAPPLMTNVSEGAVLVVEDEASIRDVVVEVLNQMGFSTTGVADGVAGLRVLQSDARIDLLVTDVGLPGLDGRQLADQGRALRPALKVLFMTGYAEDPLFGGRMQEAGMQMITKPFAVRTLSERVRAMITS